MNINILISEKEVILNNKQDVGAKAIVCIGQIIKHREDEIKIIMDEKNNFYTKLNTDFIIPQ